MKIKDMFVKPIDRDIQGVIIVGQGEETNVAQELEEYVVTKELQKHFAEFFEVYKKGVIGNTNEIGVWISGFFGSGKSHFLKILSYLLANKEVNGKKAIEYFEDDNKISDAMVLADMKLAAETPSDVILFNIDSKSDATGKSDKDAIVNVFLKVFNEVRGFCGQSPYLADLEEALTDANKYDEFKTKFEEYYGSAWEESRHRIDFIEDDVVDSLVDIDFMSESSARNWFEKANEAYRISIEDFAKRVKRYIDKKGNNHHVVFMVDEVGQYIGEDSNLMLNLQTVREELSKECKGKAWVVVTSQQDIDSITKVKGNDFSKIQGRFATRLSLSSANVDEVIKKRILAKTDVASETLRVEYEQKSTVIKNLIFFNDGIEKKIYSGENDYAEVYPFIPYQFNLLAAVLTSIRTHGASGKHLSEGERSMLALFKESAMALKENESGTIIPFYRFYNALESFLDHSHRGVIMRAYDNSYINPEKKEADVFAVDVLKTLFMIKYVNEIEANIENITTLMVDNINQDRITLKNKVEEALKVLISQMLVQKNDKLYVFLTDEEQEINREIENQSVDRSEVIASVSNMLFEGLFTDKKYRYPEFNGRYSFPFNQKVDDRPYKGTQSYDFGLSIITPWYEGGTDDTTLRMMSGQGNEVIVLLPDDTAFLDELHRYLKIEKYLRLSSSSQLTKYETIKESKRVEMRERNSNAKLYLQESLKDATIYVNGDVAKLSSKDVTSRINEALGRLVQTVYHKLPYITEAKNDSDIRKLFIADNQLTLDLGDAGVPNQNALMDVLAFIKTNTNIHMKTSMKSIKDRFMRAPYGFVEDDVFWLVARLFKNGDLLFTVNGANVTVLNKEPDEIISYITKKQFVDKLLIEEREKVPENYKKAVRTTIKELFNVSSASDDEDTMMKNFQKYSTDMIHKIEVLETNYTTRAFPGKDVLKEGKALLTGVLRQSTPKDFFEYVFKNQEELLDYADDYDPLSKFFKGEQHTIFSRALDMLEIYDDSKTYIVNAELEKIVDEMRSIVSKKMPYSDIPKLPELREKFMDIYTSLLQEETKPVVDSIDSDQRRVIEEVTGKEYENERKSKYTQLFIEIRDGAESCNNISILRSYADRSDALKIRLLNEMAALDAEIKKKKSSNEVGVAVDVPEKRVKNITAKTVTQTKTWTIKNEDDIDKYLKQMKSKIMSELDDNTTINIEF
jgi:hypothetical protein